MHKVILNILRTVRPHVSNAYCGMKSFLEHKKIKGNIIIIITNIKNLKYAALYFSLRPVLCSRELSTPSVFCIGAKTIFG